MTPRLKLSQLKLLQLKSRLQPSRLKPIKPIKPIKPTISAKAARLKSSLSLSLSLAKFKQSLARLSAKLGFAKTEPHFANSIEAQKNLPQTPRSLITRAKHRRRREIVRRTIGHFFRPRGHWSTGALLLSAIVLISGLAVAGAYFSDSLSENGAASAGCLQITPTLNIDGQAGSLANDSFYGKATCIPPQYSQVEYLQFAWNSSIDTGVPASSNLTITTKAELTNLDLYQYLFGERDCDIPSCTTNALMLATTDSNQFSIYHNALVRVDGFTLGPHVYNYSSTQTTVDGTAIANYTTSSYTGVNSIYLGGFNSNGTLLKSFSPAVLKFYSFSMANGNTPVRNFIPVRDNTTGECLMWDAVTHQPFKNFGQGAITCPTPVASPNCDNLLCNNEFEGDTGVAVAPNTIHKFNYSLANTGTANWQNYIGDTVGGWIDADYTPVDYATFDGHEYIDTGIKASNTLNTTIDAQFSSAVFVPNVDNYLLGTRDCAAAGCTTNAYMLGINWSTTASHGYSLYYGGASLGSTYGTADDLRHTFALINGTLTISSNGANISLTTSTASSTFTSSNAISLGGYNNNGAVPTSFFIGKMYSVQMGNGNTLVRNLVPVINNFTGACGFYDTVSQSFFANAGTGTLVCAAPATSVNTPRLVIYPASTTDATITSSIAAAKTAAAAGTVSTFSGATCVVTGVSANTGVTPPPTADMNFISGSTDTGCQLSAVNLNDPYNTSQSKTYTGAKFVLFVPNALASNAAALATMTVNFGVASGARNVITGGGAMLGNWKEQVHPWVSAGIMPAEATSYTKLTVSDFVYNGADGTNGSVQLFTAPVTGQYLLETWGAQGGGGTTANQKIDNSYVGIAGYGGYATGVIYLTAGQQLHVFVGGQGQLKNQNGVAVAGGWNGGGSGQALGSSNYNYHGGGGGATDIRLGGTDLSNRIIVAGGGGGAGGSGNSNTYNGIGGAGGGQNGLSGSTEGGRTGGAGGSQTAGGAAGCYDGATTNCGTAGTLGIGGNAGDNSANAWVSGGGGGGYYGGGGAGAGGPGGGGGSGYVGGVLSVAGFPAQTIAGDTSFAAPGGGTEIGHAGNGYARITLLQPVWAN